ALLAFDAPSRDVCTVQRETTNTPLQALITLHGSIYIEAARKLAERLMEKAHPIRTGFRTVLSREAEDEELQRLAAFYQDRREHYENHPAAAQRLLQVGASPGGQSADLAALTDVCHTLLNLSETITRK
ncbi:MAG: DUF1553 domain-containing protein, partial [Verrucomicrobiota bacterium]